MAHLPPPRARRTPPPALPQGPVRRSAAEPQEAQTQVALWRRFGAGRRLPRDSPRTCSAPACRPQPAACRCTRLSTRRAACSSRCSARAARATGPPRAHPAPWPRTTCRAGTVLPRGSPSPSWRPWRPLRSACTGPARRCPQPAACRCPRPPTRRTAPSSRGSARGSSRAAPWPRSSTTLASYHVPATSSASTLLLTGNSTSGGSWAFDATFGAEASVAVHARAAAGALMPAWRRSGCVEMGARESLRGEGHGTPGVLRT